jgi:ribonucleoside-diphosphate reductase alpha chain
MKFERYFSTLAMPEKSTRDVELKNDKGEVIFEQKGVEAPKTWSDLAVQITASKFFRGPLDDSGPRESSVYAMVMRVTKTIARSGLEQGYFDAENAQVFAEELSEMVLLQVMSFNSPVWFNVGVQEHPQCSACFIQSVEDSMQGIMDLATREAMIFKDGSGSGTNFSSLRSSKERLSNGGKPSGPIPFMKALDGFAGAIKSGGKTRRAAKMAILNVDHPDALEFIRCKSDTNDKANVLIDAGFDGSIGGDVQENIPFHNQNNTVRVNDDFMERAEAGEEWQFREVVSGRQIPSGKNADTILREIATHAHRTGDPGIQFDDTINKWNTCANSGRIEASNPCGEFNWLDDSACNLASLNLLWFHLNYANNREFNVFAFRRAIELTIIAQDIMVKMSSYPSKLIEENSHKFRPLGLGYCNLGALLMANGLAYDSDGGRSMAANITSLMTAQAYFVSAKISRELGAFSAFEENKEPMMSVIYKHYEACPTGKKGYPEAIFTWKEAIAIGREFGFRNAQVTLLAPTGTTGFMMDCDSTGVEPCIALVSYKKLAGGGTLHLVNRAAKLGLEALGYDEDRFETLVKDYAGSVEGLIREEHLPVFYCAFAAPGSNRCISWQGHIKMMAAVQPFLSGAISKTVNMPHDATVLDVESAYYHAWKMGLKALAIYRDGCKRVQPITTSKDQPKEEAPHENVRRRLPDTGNAKRHKFSVGGHEGYLHVGLFEDGTVGEIFVTMSKTGSTILGLLDAWATSVSLNLQMGYKLEELCNKFEHTSFEPRGFTSHVTIHMASSIVDYIVKFLRLEFCRPPPDGAKKVDVVELGTRSPIIFQNSLDAPPCPTCGSIMVRNGACHKCLTCGGSSGCS